MATNTHVISGDFDMLLGEAKYLPWSSSRADTANACLYKFKKVYLEGIKESSPALTLGGLAHEIIAELLKDKNPSVSKAELFLGNVYPLYKVADSQGAALAEVKTMFPYMVSFVDKWLTFCSNRNIKKFRVEHPYGWTRELTRASYNPSPIRETYFRGIIDLWAYDPVAKEIFIIDHKTNKSAASKNKVKESKQLNLYVSMISKIYNLEWTRAYIGLNFLRKNRIVWNSVTPVETAYFTQIYMNTLAYLETRLYECDNSTIWPANKSFQCSWCTFKDTCKTYLNEV